MSTPGSSKSSDSQPEKRTSTRSVLDQAEDSKSHTKASFGAFGSSLTAIPSSTASVNPFATRSAGSTSIFGTKTGDLLGSPGAASAGAGSVFGASSQAESSGSIFGTKSPRTGALFGPPSTTSAGSGSSGIFGAPSTNSGGSFGQSATTTAGSGNLFATPSAGSSSSGSFGVPSPGSGGLFGLTGAATTSSKSLFSTPPDSSGTHLGPFGTHSSKSQTVSQSSTSLFSACDDQLETSQLFKHLDTISLRAFAVAACKKDQELLKTAWSLLDTQEVRSISRLTPSESEFYRKAIWIVDNLHSQLTGAILSSIPQPSIHLNAQNAIKEVPTLCDFVINKFVFARPSSFGPIILGLAKLFLTLLDVSRGFLNRDLWPESAPLLRADRCKSPMTVAEEVFQRDAEKQAGRVADLLLKMVDIMLASPPPPVVPSLFGTDRNKGERDPLEEHKASVLRYYRAHTYSMEESVDAILRRTGKLYGSWLISLPVRLAHSLLMPSLPSSTTGSDAETPKPGSGNSQSSSELSKSKSGDQDAARRSRASGTANDDVAHSSSDAAAGNVHAASTATDRIASDASDAANSDNGSRTNDGEPEDEEKTVFELSGVAKDTKSATDAAENVFELPTTVLPMRPALNEAASSNRSKSSSSNSGNNDDHDDSNEEKPASGPESDDGDVKSESAHGE